MSLLATTNKDIITNELADRIHVACENESQLIDAYLKEHPNGPPPKLRLTYSFNIERIIQAQAYFRQTGQTIRLMKINNHPAFGNEARAYYVYHNGRYFTVVTDDDEITSCVQT